MAYPIDKRKLKIKSGDVFQDYGCSPVIVLSVFNGQVMYSYLRGMGSAVRPLKEFKAQVAAYWGNIRELDRKK